MIRKLSIILSSEAPHESNLWIKPIDEFRWELTYFNGVEWRPLDITYFNSVDREKLDYIFDFIDELDAAHFGLGNVDNTSDLNKPVSAATQEALDNKINLPTTGVKVTGIDAGTFGTISITDDYIYFCGVTGDSNNAVWFPIENSIKTQQTLTSLETVLKTYTDNKFAEKVGVYNVSYCVPIYPEYYSSMEAREAVAVSIRKPGLVLTYEDYEKHWVVERFIGASLSNWLVNEEWEEIAITKEYTDNLLSNKEDKLPAIPSNPELKFLNGLKEWTSIVIGAGGYTAPLYFTNIDSDIQGYKKISNIPDSSITELSTTLTSSEGKKFFRAYICDDSINTTTIDAGPWVSSFLVKVSNATGYTNLVLDVYRRTSIGTEILLFTANSTEINQTNFTETTRNQSDQGVFVTELTDRIVFKVYGETTTGSTITITTSIGGAEASYVTTPIALRHRQLREPNENENYLHITKEAQTFDGVKTFIDSPLVPDITIDSVDGAVINKKILNEANLLKVDKTSIVNNLTTTDAGHALDARQGPVITTAIDTKATHGYTGTAKTLKEVDDEKVSKTGDETIAGVKTFSSSPVIPTPTTDMQSSTKKYVDDADALRVLKSEQSITNKTLAEVLSTIDARILSLETFVKGNLGDITVNTINIIRGVNQYGSDGNAEIKASGAPVVIPDYIGQQYTDTANGNIYKAKNNTAVADWVKIN